jgi:hypothetical protein
MTNLEEAEKKLKYADFLLNRPNNDGYLSGILTHLLRAANIAVAEHLNVQGSVSPNLIQNQLAQAREPEVIEFSKTYIELWKLSAKIRITKQEIGNAYKSVKSFVYWVKQNKENQI